MNTEVMTQAQPQKAQALAITNFDSLLRVSEFLAQSSLIPVSLRQKPADVAIVLSQGQELGLGPMQSLNGIEVIQGRPTIKPEMALALIRARIPDAVIRIEKATESEAIVYMARSHNDEEQGNGYRAHWTLAKARLMGLMGKDNYKKQPGTMLRWRAVGEAARTMFSDILKGLYVEGEIERETKDVNSEVVNKGARLEQKLMGNEFQETSSELLPEDVQSEQGELSESNPQAGGLSEDIDPSVESTATDSDDPLAQFIIPVGSLQGKTLAEVGATHLAEITTGIREHVKLQRKELTGEWLLFVSRAEDYIQSQQI